MLWRPGPRLDLICVFKDRKIAAECVPGRPTSVAIGIGPFPLSDFFRIENGPFRKGISLDRFAPGQKRSAFQKIFRPVSFRIVAQVDFVYHKTTG